MNRRADTADAPHECKMIGLNSVTSLFGPIFFGAERKKTRKDLPVIKKGVPLHSLTKTMAG
jgi:hypothetical protein